MNYSHHTREVIGTAGLIGTSLATAALPAGGIISVLFALPTLPLVIGAATLAPIVMGAGFLYMPYVWWKKGNEQKEDLEKEARRNITKHFDTYRFEAVKGWKKQGEQIAQRVKEQYEDEVNRLRDTMDDMRKNRPTQQQLEILKHQSETLNRLMLQGAEWFNGV
jgi:nitrogen fixation-related uncharacterized protein